MLRIVAVLGLLASAAPQPPRAPDPFGDPERITTRHLTVEAGASDRSVAQGGRVRVTVDVSPRPGMHVYAPGTHDYQVVSLTIDPQPWLAAAPAKYPPSEIYHFVPLDERVPVYSKPFRLTREVHVLSTPEARRALEGRTSVTLTAALEYQACDDKVCYAPAKVPVRFVLTVKQEIDLRPRLGTKVNPVA